MATTNTIWPSFSSSKIRIQSGEFSSTIRDSVFVGGFANAIGNSTNNIDVIFNDNTGDQLHILSGLITSTIKNSISVSAVDTVPQDVSYSETNTVWTGDQANKFYLASGQFTTTLKTSGASSDSIPLAVSWDGTNTPNGGLNKSKLLLTSGQFTTTIKTSQSVSERVDGISFNGTDTPWTGFSANKLRLVSGQFTSTIKTSLDTTSIDPWPVGIDTNDVDSRLGEDQAEFYSVFQTAEAESSSTTGENLVELRIDRSTKTGSKDFMLFGTWAMGGNNTTQKYSSKLRIDTTDLHDWDNHDFGSGHNTTGRQDQFFQMKKVTLDATEHTFNIHAKTTSATAGREVVINNACLVAWEFDNDMQYAESNGITTQTDETYVDKVTTTFTSSAEDVLIVASGDISWDDDSDPGGLRITDDDTELIRQEQVDVIGPTMDGIYYPFGMVALLSNDTSTSAVAALEIKGGGVGDAGNIRNARIFALPLGNFTHHTATNDNQETTSATYVTGLTTSPTIANAGRHVAFYGSQHGITPSDDYGVQADFAGTTFGDHSSIDLVDVETAGNDLPRTFAAAGGGVLNTGLRTFAMNHLADGTQTHHLDNNSITIIQVQDAPAAPTGVGDDLMLIGVGS